MPVAQHPILVQRPHAALYPGAFIRAPGWGDTVDDINPALP